jgi:hypothetical protein
VVRFVKGVRLPPRQPVCVDIHNLELVKCQGGFWTILS